MEAVGSASVDMRRQSFPSLAIHALESPSAFSSIFGNESISFWRRSFRSVSRDFSYKKSGSSKSFVKD